MDVVLYSSPHCMIQSQLIISIGVLLLLGLITDQVGRRTKLPRVSLLLVCGVSASALGIIPQQLLDTADTMTAIALAMVAFLLGGHFKIADLTTLRPWTREPLAKVGDANRQMMVGEFSLKNKNYLSSPLISNLTTT